MLTRTYDPEVVAGMLGRLFAAVQEVTHVYDELHEAGFRLPPDVRNTISKVGLDAEMLRRRLVAGQAGEGAE